MFVFEIANGKSGEIKIKEPLLDTEERAMARANAEFLNGAYTTETIQFSTYLTDIGVGDTVEVEGLWYRVIDVQMRWDEKSIVSDITGERYAS